MLSFLNCLKNYFECPELRIWKVHSVQSLHNIKARPPAYCTLSVPHSQVWNESSPTPLEKFLRTIITCPELAPCVRVIEVQRGWLWHSYSPSAYVGSAAVIQPIEELRAGQSASVSESSNNKFFKVAEQDTPEIREVSWAKMFLTHLPNLQSLHVHGIKWSCWLLLTEILDSTTCQGSIEYRPFSKLRNISIQYFPRMYSFHQDTFFDSSSGLISYLLQLSSLRTLKLVGFRDTLFESGAR